MSENTTNGLGGIHDQNPTFTGTAQDALELILKQSSQDLRDSAATIDGLEGTPSALLLASGAINAHAESLFQSLASIEKKLADNLDEPTKDKISKTLQNLTKIQDYAEKTAKTAKAELPKKETPQSAPNMASDNLNLPEGVQTKSFFIIPFGNQLPTDEHGAYVWASPSGSAQDDPYGQQYHKLYVSNNLAESGAYLDNLDRLSGAKGLDVDISIKQAKNGRYEFFEVDEAFSSSAKKMAIIDAKGKHSELGVTRKLQKAFIDHFSLSVDREVCQHTATTVMMSASGASNMLSQRKTQERFIQRSQEEKGVKELFAQSGITEEQMSDFYHDYTADKSVKELLAGKLPKGKTIKINGEDVNSIAQNLCSTQDAQLPAEVKEAMKNDPEILMAITLTRTLQRTVADQIVDNNQGVLKQEMETLEGKQDKYGTLLLPRQSKLHSFGLFKESRLEDLNEEYSQLYAFKYVSMASVKEGSTLFDPTNLFSTDAIDKNPSVLNGSNVIESDLPLTDYLAKRRSVLSDITTTDLNKAQSKGMKGEVTTVGNIMGTLDEIKYKSGKPMFGEKPETEKESGDWKSITTAMDEVASSVQSLMEGIEGSIAFV